MGSFLFQLSNRAFGRFTTVALVLLLGALNQNCAPNDAPPSANKSNLESEGASQTEPPDLAPPVLPPVNPPPVNPPPTNVGDATAIRTFVNNISKDAFAVNATEAVIQDAIQSYTLGEDCRAVAEIVLLKQAPALMRWNEQSEDQFLARVYTATLDRAFDDPGFVYWTHWLRDGGTRPSLVTDFIQSYEFQSRCDQLGLVINSRVGKDDPNLAAEKYYGGIAQLVRHLYKTGLGREAELAGLHYHIREFDASKGSGAHSRARVILASAEASTHTAAFTPRQYVDYAANVLKANPDQAIRSHMAKMITEGKQTRAQVVEDLITYFSKLGPSFGVEN